jgi:hypothetical protein
VSAVRTGLAEGVFTTSTSAAVAAPTSVEADDVLLAGIESVVVVDTVAV